MDQIKQNAKWVFLGIGVISFLFFGLLSSISGPMGTSTNGFDVVFNGEGLGFSRILMLFTILAPLCAAVYAFVVPEAKWGKNLLYIFGGGVVRYHHPHLIPLDVWLLYRLFVPRLARHPLHGCRCRSFIPYESARKEIIYFCF